MHACAETRGGISTKILHRALALIGIIIISVPRVFSLVGLWTWAWLITIENNMYTAKSHSDQSSHHLATWKLNPPLNFS